MTHASLFSGIGGPEVAAAMLGWKNAFHCEINPFGRQVLEYWFPDSVSYEDITKTNFKEWRGRIDVLTGGFPCQPFSYAGKRGGREDERYLWPEMLRAIDEIRPTWVVGENVAGLATMVEGGVLSDLGGYATLFQEGDDVHGYELEQTFTIERICRDLEHLGYSVQPVLIPAAAVGAPHRRDRIFICAHRDGDNLNGWVPQREIPGGKDTEPAGYGTRLQHGERYDLRGAAANTDGGDDVRVSGEDAGESGEERLQERDEVRLAGVAGELRPEVCGDAADTDGGGCPSYHKGRGVTEEGRDDALAGERGLKAKRTDGLPSLQRNTSDSANVRQQRGIDSGAEEKVCGEVEGEGYCAKRVVSTTATSRGWVASNTDRRDGERECQVERGIPGWDGLDGDGSEWPSANTDGKGREEPVKPGRGEDCKEEGAGVDDRIERPGCDGELANSVCEGLEGQDQPRPNQGGERLRVRGNFAGHDRPDLRPENRWACFPSVSPVHRGNDGIPIRLDNLSISFSKWRTESLKAYGNAIVPQVMYRIFQAIEEASQ